MSKLLPYNGIPFENRLSQNICFINSTMSAFLNCKSIMDLLNTAQNCELINEMKQCLISKDNTHSTENIQDFLIRHNIQGFEKGVQGDPTELIGTLVDLSEALKKPIAFKTHNKIKCTECPQESPEISYTREIDVYSINDAINKTSVDENIKFNRFEPELYAYCVKCDRDTKKEKTEIFTSLPQILMVTVKRWVKYNVNVPATKYHIEIKPDTEITINDTKYSLKSVVEHVGDDTERGHYTASCIQENGTWIKCNDKNISQSELPMEGYIFFYEKSPSPQYANITYDNLSNQNDHVIQSNFPISIKEKQHTCQFCNLLFSKNSELTDHLNTHSVGNPYQCMHCKQSFSQNCHLITYLKTNAGDTTFNCNFCNLSFPINSDLINHLSIHVTEYKCYKCVKLSPTMNETPAPVTTHCNDIVYNCTHCDSSFTLKQDLENHINTHNGGMSFLCNICDKDFMTNEDLQLHITTHTVNIEKQYKCSNCDKVFPTLSEKFAHAAVHTDEDLHHCRLCNLSFTSKERRENHLNTHIGGKTFQCNICDKPFQTHDKLNLHLKTHNESKSYECSTCHKVFTTKKAIIIHTGETLHTL